MSASTNRTQPQTRPESTVDRLDAEITALRQTADDLNNGYAHSGLTNPRAERLLARADGMQYALDALRAEQPTALGA